VVADRRSYDMGGDDYRAVLSNWAALLKLDAIFLVGSLPESGQILREARAAGLTVPVFGGAGLDSPDLIRLGGQSVEGTVVFSLFNAGAPHAPAHAFAARYQARYGVAPDATAAQGYDTLKLLAHAMQRAQGTLPARVADALRATRQWHGATGVHTFNPQGDLVAKPLAKVVVRDGRFVYFDRDPPLQGERLGAR